MAATCAVAMPPDKCALAGLTPIGEDACTSSCRDAAVLSLTNTYALLAQCLQLLQTSTVPAFSRFRLPRNVAGCAAARGP